MTQEEAVMACFEALFNSTKGTEDSLKYPDQDLNSKNYTR
jgi:hypothetical protein